MTANLYKKNDKYHVMLNWYHNDKRKQKSIATGIPAHGNNKRKAEAERKRILQEWEEKITDNFNNILFSDYLMQWLEIAKSTIAPTTYYGYKQIIKNQICPFFMERKLALRDLKTHHIQEFYAWTIQTHSVTANSIHHYHANISRALKDAVRTELIKDNPASRVVLPRKERYRGDYYTLDELRKLIAAVQDTKLEVPVILASWFGMRRGEIVGVRWDAINFEARTLYMCGTITDKGDWSQTENLTYRDYGKTPSSIRTFPLTDDMIVYLKTLRRKQLEHRLLVGNEYNKKWIDFVCVDEIGNLIQPAYISYMFPKFLIKHGLRKIRFHDLRHTNATLLLEDGATLKEVQDWMGHKSFSTTADTYAHVQAKAKQKLADTISNIISSSQ